MAWLDTTCVQMTIRVNTWLYVTVYFRRINTKISHVPGQKSEFNGLVFDVKSSQYYYSCTNMSLRLLRKITDFRLVKRSLTLRFHSRLFSMSAPQDDVKVLPSGLRDIVKTPKGLEVKIFYLECLAHASYTIHHKESAFVIDPRRDVDAYISEAQKGGWSIEGVLETHVHADFVSGHCELAERTGATIYFGPGASDRLKFPHHEVKDGELLDITDVYAIKVLHTPGHTMESVVWLVVDKEEGNRPIHAFTGDTLFIGSCGRPDLIGTAGHTAKEMSERMFYSLKNKICTLPDDVKVFPAHGAGSPCGKNLSSDLYSTIEKEKATNPALQYNNVDKFVEYLTEGQPAAPMYFTHDVQTNLEGAGAIANEVAQIVKMSPEEIKEKTVPDYAAAHVEGSINISLGTEGGATLSVEDGNFCIWVGSVISKDDKIYLINEPGRDKEAVQRLARIGYKTSGILDGGIEAWKNAGLPLASHKRIDLSTKDENLQDLLSTGYKLLDVRTPPEYSNNCAKVAMNTPLANLAEYFDKLDKNTPYICYCAAGYRSSIATSLLNQHGFKAMDIYGGFAAISVFNPELTTTGKVCPTMKKVIDQLLQ
ncbi:uncharacterized protein [Dysidea avara]|uniref:uncharacterized protein n=1 Tax=Dysidea avara TaxID=196820 RepID=UPI00331B792E